MFLIRALNKSLSERIQQKKNVHANHVRGFLNGLIPLHVIVGGTDIILAYKHVMNQ